ncbi:GntR family transcriptional regulator, partial [Pseudomonas viridiflava]|uniref:GntR family transcriptional regulator n=1 Tax=Pseudomonas viridiflava TaxID=33069 RepID=UPI0013DEDD3B
MSLNALYNSLKQRLESGEWLAGQRMPSIRKQASTSEASYHDAVSAYARLVSEGLLSASPGRGYFVTSSASQSANPREPACTSTDPLFRLLQAGPQYTKLGGGWLLPAWRDRK